MRFISHILCVLALVCQLVVSGFVSLHKHECEVCPSMKVSHTVQAVMDHHDCGHCSHHNHIDTVVASSEVSETVSQMPHSHPCECYLNTRLLTFSIENSVVKTRNAKTQADDSVASDHAVLFREQHRSLAPPRVSEDYIFYPEKVRISHLYGVYLI